ncbi:MAG: hypothetical protein ABL984_16295, partial [Pyrinomonadaceae bacterium]
IRARINSHTCDARRDAYHISPAVHYGRLAIFPPLAGGWGGNGYAVTRVFFDPGYRAPGNFAGIIHKLN